MDGPILELFWTFSDLVKSCSNRFPIDDHCPPLVLLPTTWYGILRQDSPPSCCSDDDGTGNGCKGLRGNGPRVVFVRPQLRICKYWRPTLHQNSSSSRLASVDVIGGSSGGKRYYLTVVGGATVGFAVRETAPAGMTHDDGFGWLRPRWFQLARRANSRPWLLRFMDRCRGSPCAEVPVCS